MSVREPGVHAEFLMWPVLHGVNSKSAGRPIHVDKPHVKIRVAGADKDEFFGPANEQMQARFPEEWEQFQKGLAAPKVGTPLSQWGGVSPAMVKNLETYNVFTVEDLASLSEIGIQKIGMGGRKLQEDARRFLSMSQSFADVSQLEEIKAANAAKDAVIAEQGKALAELQAQMAQILAEKTPMQVVTPEPATPAPDAPDPDPAPRKRRVRAEA